MARFVAAPLLIWGGALGKRFIDIVLGGLLAIFAFPLIVALALVSAVVFRSWPFFFHERVGYKGRRFRVPKLRTLPKTVSITADKYDVAALPLPAFARLLRRTHLDELPQLFLVPFGHMTLVGPRPEMPALHYAGDSAFAAARVSKRPGCTGLWQISADSHRLIWEAPAYDLFYVHQASLRLDLWVLWRTGLLVTGLGGLTTLDQVPNWALRTKRGPEFAPEFLATGADSRVTTMHR